MHLVRSSCSPELAAREEIPHKKLGYGSTHPHKVSVVPLGLVVLKRPHCGFSDIELQVTDWVPVTDVMVWGLGLRLP